MAKSIYNLDLTGWNRRSTWGWDPALETLYALLTRNDSHVNIDMERPDIWISVATGYPRITRPAALAEAIANATGVGTAAAVLAAMGDSLSGGEFWVSEDDRPVRMPKALFSPDAWLSADTRRSVNTRLGVDPRPAPTRPWWRFWS